MISVNVPVITNISQSWQSKPHFQITNLMHISFILQQYVCYTTILNMFRAARC